MLHPDTVTEDQLTEPTDRMIAWVKNSALYRLSRKMMSEQELRDALKAKALRKFETISEGVAEMIAEAGIRWCNENRFLDDEAFAEVKTASAVRSGRSKRRIAMDLNNKGIAQDLIDASLSEVDDLLSAITYARRKAFGPFRKVALDEKRKAKEFAAFARNGFSSSLALRVVNMTDEEVHDFSGGQFQR